MGKRYNVAILGAGNIANAMAQAIKGLGDNVCAYAVAARDLERAEAFAKKWGFQKAYGSYLEMVEDPDVDLVYVCTPHSHHYEHAMLCLDHNKPCLVEKSFTANARLAEDVFDKAKEKGILVTEAIWTRYLPARHIVKDILESGALGEVYSMEAEFSAEIAHLERMHKPELAGGSLLDLGVYCLTFASMYFGNHIVKVETECELYDDVVDGCDKIRYTYLDGKIAELKTSMIGGNVNQAAIFGSKGRLEVRNTNNYDSIIRYDLDGNVVEVYAIPEQINGYEYELLAALKAIEEGKIECPEMPHEESIEIMKQMDYLRKEWGVVYPWD